MVESSFFGQLSTGENVEKFVLENANGLRVELLSYGGIITRIETPNREGKRENVVLNYSTLEGYENDMASVGALVGRYANRIAKARFLIEEKVFGLTKNHGKHHLHGGIKGFNKQCWQVEDKRGSGKNVFALHYHSQDGEEGFPGNLKCQVQYELSDDNTLTISYRATTDRKTHFNPTQHSYFNLSGKGKSTIYDHTLQVFSNEILEMDFDLIPTGKKQSVVQTPFDFSTAKSLRDALKENHPMLDNAKGFDVCYAFPWTNEKRLMGTLIHPESGRGMRVLSSMPGMQLYTGNHLSAPFIPYGGICLETQFFPDSPNQSSFPKTLLHPGETFTSTTEYQFFTF